MGFMAVFIIIATVVIPSPQSMLSLVTELKSQSTELKSQYPEHKLSETSSLPPSIFTPQKAYAITTTLDSVSCETVYGGTWIVLSSTCKISTGGVTISTGDELVIPAGITLSITINSGFGIDNAGTITN